MRVSQSELQQKQMEFKAQFTMDSKMRRGAAGQTPLTRLLGHAISNPGLAKMKPTDGPGAVMTRANNLSSLVAAMLLQIRPEKREDALTEIAGNAYTQQVLKFASNYPGGLGVTDAIRFSLALHFMLGILDTEAGKSTFFGDGYKSFARLFKDIQDRRAGRAPAEEVNGLSGLGQVGKPARQGGAPAPAPAPAPPPKTSSAPAPPPKAAPPPSTSSSSNTAPANPPPLVSTDPACPRWTPTNPCYPRPTDKARIDYSLFQADVCGDIFTPLAKKQTDKGIGIRRIFNAVFAREPNNAEMEYFGQMKWCANALPTDPARALTDRMIWVREMIETGRSLNTTPVPLEDAAAAPGEHVITQFDFGTRTVLTDIGTGLQKAAEAAFDFLGKAADWVADIMCKGFKAIFGDAIGGVMCDIITFLTRMMTAGVAAIIDIVIESLRGTFEFIQLMTKGKLEDAFTALLRSMGRVLFSLAAPLMVPILMADKGKGRSMSDAFRELKARSDRVTKKEPLWPLMVIMAVMGVFSAVSGNVLGAITGLIVALTPMVATFISEPLKQNIIELRQEPLEVIEAGIGKFIKFVLLIFNGAMAIKDLIPKLRGQLAALMKGKGAGAFTGKGNTAEKVKTVIERFMKGVDVIVNAFKNFNVKDITESAGPLLMLIPDVLLALLGEEGAEAMPSLTEWKETVNKTVKDVNEKESTLRAGAQELFSTFTLNSKITFIQEQATAPEISPQNAAAMVATVYAKQFKNKTTYPAFAAAFRMELLKA
jgi:hypothetical protein